MSFASALTLPLELAVAGAIAFHVVPAKSLYSVRGAVTVAFVGLAALAVIDMVVSGAGRGLKEGLPRCYGGMHGGELCSEVIGSCDTAYVENDKWCSCPSCYCDSAEDCFANGCYARGANCPSSIP